jgi:carbon-monoxide dehydrogenase large subunit
LGWISCKARRLDASGKLRGIGVANYVEITGGAPRERAEITVQPGGRVELVMGTMSSGQGLETSFAQLVTEWLGVPFENITYVAHDTARVAAGGGSHSGRSMKLATTISVQAMVERARLAEPVGYGTVWLADERFYREVYSCLGISLPTHRKFF